ncbi:hypothetical protein ACQP2P_12580 [Dactylosporangium sp. CA-139114]|uniref:hypothetical protein n=1 Tax=Dactylosporangium sp. CA-139114 TaxID=3239931 RepID=UPI003D98DB87
MLYAGLVAGRSKLATAGTAVTLGAGYLLAQDVVVQLVAQQSDWAAAVAMVSDYQS